MASNADAATGSEGTIVALGSVTALRLMWLYLLGARGKRPGVDETVLFRSARGYPWLLYSPAGKQRCPITLIHGVTARASEDVNLVHLARCIAQLGHPCLTPPLDGLAQFAHTDDDIGIVADALQRTYKLFNTQTAVWAFSYGASYALSAAARPDCRHACRYLVGFGAYFELDAALRHQQRLLEDRPDPSGDDSDLLYLRYTLLIANRDQLDLPSSAWSDIDRALTDFMSPTPLHEKQRALLQHARHFDYAELMRAYRRRELPRALSPAGRMSGIPCPVALLHDPHDRFIPPDQVELIRRELDCRTNVSKTQTLTTHMLSHVRVDPMRNVRDAWKLVQLLSFMFEGDHPSKS